MALGRIGVSQFIANIDTEKSVEAVQCRTYYDQDVEITLRAFPWPFATGYRALPLVTEEPTSDWTYAYRYPNDALALRRVVTTMGRDEPNPPPFVVGQDDQGLLIYSNEADATIEYTVKVTNPARFDPFFVEALSWKLASDIAPALTRIKGAQEAAYKMYLHSIAYAEVAVANEQRRGPEGDSEFVTGRQ